MSESKYKTYYKCIKYSDDDFYLTIKTSKLPVKTPVDDDLPFPLPDLKSYIDWQTSIETLKLSNIRRSITRAKQSIQAYCKVNSFSWFVTLTFSSDKDVVANRLDDEETISLFKKWRKAVKRSFPQMVYLAVPEYHKKGGIHFHILVGGLTAQDLKLSFYKTMYNKSGEPYDVFSVGAWSFGYSTATKIRYPERVSSYICKYLTKQDLDIRFYRRNRFYHSDNILKPVIISWNEDAPCCDVEYFKSEDVELFYDVQLVYEDKIYAFRKFKSIT